MVQITQLNQRLNKEISEICKNGYVDDAVQHCAHYVSHVLGFSFGTTCKSLTHGGGPGACVRVAELFSKCPTVGKWIERPPNVNQCLIFITGESNISVPKKQIFGNPARHVGIFASGMVWHYNNKADNVKCITPQEFGRHYRGAGYSLFYGTMPQ